MSLGYIDQLDIPPSDKWECLVSSLILSKTNFLVNQPLPPLQGGVPHRTVDSLCKRSQAYNMLAGSSTTQEGF